MGSISFEVLQSNKKFFIVLIFAIVVSKIVNLFSFTFLKDLNYTNKKRSILLLLNLQTRHHKVKLKLVKSVHQRVQFGT